MLFKCLRDCFRRKHCEKTAKMYAIAAVGWCGKGGLDCGFRRLVVLISAVGGAVAGF